MIVASNANEPQMVASSITIRCRSCGNRQSEQYVKARRRRVWPVLNARYIMVGGRYCCSGIRAAVEGLRIDLVDTWLARVKAVYAKHQKTLMALSRSTD